MAILREIDSPKFVLTRELEAEITPFPGKENMMVATSRETGISVAGKDEADALVQLGKMLVIGYQSLNRTPANRLSPKAAQQLALFKELLKTK